MQQSTISNLEERIFLEKVENVIWIKVENYIEKVKNIFEKVEFLLKMWKIVIWIKVDSVIEKQKKNCGKCFWKSGKCFWKSGKL